MSTHKHFLYNEAFSRNIGWVTDWEQQILRSKKIAIAGMGGVGGIHVLTLARLGIENFSIADPDTFELANFNRQVGAYVSTLGTAKTETLRALAKDINPNVKITSFNAGVEESTISDFLKDADLYLDGLDFYVLEVRRKIFKRCRELEIPAITAAPLGMGTSYLIFKPEGMSFEDYFGFTGDPESDQLKFLMGLNPSAAHRTYLMDRSKVDFKNKIAPSTIMSCTLAAGVIATEALKILLHRGRSLNAPWYQSFDSYLNRYTKGYLAGGGKNFLQSLRVMLIRKFLLKGLEQKTPLNLISTPSNNVLENILNYAKWSPSGDNSQPWQFEIHNENAVSAFIHNEDSVYDYAGKPSLWTVGFLTESFKIAASHYGYRTEWNYHSPGPKLHTVNFRIEKKPSIQEDHLFPFLTIRSVNRFSYQIRPLTQKHKTILAASLGDHLKVTWFESFSDRLKISKLNAAATHIRLSIKEAYETHKRMMDFKNDYSPDKVPIKAAGISPFVQKLMQFAMGSWERVDFMNKFMLASIVPQLEMDIIPGIRCAAHFIVELKDPSKHDDPQTLINAGRSLQRFWLQLTQLGLVMQPGIATISFSYYGYYQKQFTQNTRMLTHSRKLAQKLDHIAPIDSIVFMGRLGFPLTTQTQPRSVRKDISLILNP